jgi:hypothetical protein
METFAGGTGTSRFANSIRGDDSAGGKYAFGTVTFEDAVDTSDTFNRVLKDEAIAERLFKQAKPKLAKFKAKAKKKGFERTPTRPLQKRRERNTYYWDIKFLNTTYTGYEVSPAFDVTN